MLNKSQSISARLSADDYAYLMSIDRNGAVTQSEKVREVIAMARESVGVQSLARSYLASAGAILAVKARYIEENQRSLLVEAVLELLAESAAMVQSSAASEPMAPSLEQGLVPVVDTFLEKILLLAQQQNPRSLHRESAQTIRQRLEGALSE
ncbi:hypothetical protein [Microbulbifer sp. 2205BS26-8]|uniref:hypothetical protein n=1 Tax=Microbulbifer sp. 2205BS26-8 TaxID=3064386 RepID=UPI00273F2C0F|nr:hypothetical protein [Microbulbifer sp. 2205BS26-8]MDP5208819.1 hypothetical protein [Microbulbifer sp. 2205BS26-8]